MFEQIDWFCWEKLPEHPIEIMGKSGWFPVKIFPSTNPWQNDEFHAKIRMSFFFPVDNTSSMFLAAIPEHIMKIMGIYHGCCTGINGAIYTRK